MSSMFPVYTECTFKCELPEKRGEQRYCKDCVEIAQIADRIITTMRERMNLMESMIDFQTAIKCDLFLEAKDCFYFKQPAYMHGYEVIQAVANLAKKAGNQ